MAATFLNFTCKPSFSILNSSKPQNSPPSHKPLSIHMAYNHHDWTSINENIDTQLKCAIPIKPPLAVSEPLHQLVFSAPRTMAPALCVAVCELIGGHKNQALVVGSVLHLMHAAFYTHEQLPFLSQPKLNFDSKFPDNIKLLSGDGILSLIFEMLARCDDKKVSDPTQYLRVIIEISRAMGPQGMIGGRYSQILNVGSTDGLEKKEGGLYACGAACGAILGGASEEEIEKLRKFGLYVGMILHDEGDGKKRFPELERLRGLAFKELEGFKERNIETISSLLDLGY